VRRRAQPPQPKETKPKKPAGLLELDRFSEVAIGRWLDISRDLDQLEDDLFFGIQPEQRRWRNEILESLERSPRLELVLTGWVRIVPFQYSNTPLSCAGSMKSIGGRFNAGCELDPGTLPPWPALYLAEDYETAFREKFQLASDGTVDGLSATDLALQKGASHSTVQLHGELENVFDMTAPANLNAVARVLKKIGMPPRARALKKKLGIAPQDLRMVQGGVDLYRAVLEHNWRQLPIQFGLPARSHVLAEMIRAANYEAILYPSTKGGKNCLAVFPDKLGAASFIELSDPVPTTVGHTRLDARTAETLSGIDDLPSQARRLLGRD
jgi:RES domain-containing protein